MFEIGQEVEFISLEELKKYLKKNNINFITMEIDPYKISFSDDLYFPFDMSDYLGTKTTISRREKYKSSNKTTKTGYRIKDSSYIFHEFLFKKEKKKENKILSLMI